MTTAQVVKTSVINNSLSKDYPHPDDHAKQITDTTGIKPFIRLEFAVKKPLEKPLITPCVNYYKSGQPS